MELVSFIILFSILSVLAFFYAHRNNGNFIQPHAFYSARVFIILSGLPFVQLFIVGLYSDMSGVVLLNSMIAISYIFFSVGFFTKKKETLNILSGTVKGFNVSNPPKTILNVHILIMAMAAITLFVYLAQKSGFGLAAWLLDPRRGYQHYRTGLGHLYVGSLAIWNFTFLYVLFFKVKKVIHLIGTTALFVLILYFYGNKGVIVYAILESVVYYNFFIKKIKLRGALIILGLFVIVFSFVFSLYSRHNTNVSLINRILHYADYYNNARMFFADFNKDFEYTYGKEYLSSLWEYVPRAAYSNKPFSYGIVKYVVEKYYPHAGERGHTPSFGAEIAGVEEYLNFGIAGVMLIGFMKGYFLSLFYRYFLKYRNFLGFVLFSNTMGFSIFPIISGNLYKVLWYVLNIVLLLLHKQIVTNAVGISSGVSSKTDVSTKGN